MSADNDEVRRRHRLTHVAKPGMRRQLPKSGRAIRPLASEREREQQQLRWGGRTVHFFGVGDEAGEQVCRCAIVLRVSVGGSRAIVLRVSLGVVSAPLGLTTP